MTFGLRFTERSTEGLCPTMERDMSNITKIYGASDDLIEIEGVITDEFNYYNDDDEAYLAFSDGTLLSVEYDKDGIWRLKRLVAGSNGYEHKSGDVVEDTMDLVTLTGPLKWVVFGKNKASAA